MTTDTNKKCTKCGLVKPLSEFYKDSKSKDGHRSDCKICYAPVGRSGHLKRNFGLTMEEYSLLSSWQNNCCALCGKPCATGRRLAVDHDHDTGQIRGLLCGNCNHRVMGNLRLFQIEMLYSYVQKPPAEYVFKEKRYVPEAYIKPKKRRRRVIKHSNSKALRS